MELRDVIIFKKIVSEIRIALELLGDATMDDFISDERTKRAVCMTVINVGELVKNLSRETRRRYSQLPWREAAGLRDIAAHKYETLRMRDVWTTVKNDFPVLLSQLERILADDSGNGAL